MEVRGGGTGRSGAQGQAQGYFQVQWSYSRLPVTLTLAPCLSKLLVQFQGQQEVPMPVSKKSQILWLFLLNVILCFISAALALVYYSLHVRADLVLLCSLTEFLSTC